MLSEEILCTYDGEGMGERGKVRGEGRGGEGYRVVLFQCLISALCQVCVPDGIYCRVWVF